MIRALTLFSLLVSLLELKAAPTYFFLPIKSTGQLGPAGTNLFQYNLLLGSNVSFVTNSDGSMVISATGGGGGISINFDPTQFSTNGGILVLTNGAFTTNLVLNGTNISGDDFTKIFIGSNPRLNSSPVVGAYRDITNTGTQMGFVVEDIIQKISGIYRSFGSFPIVSNSGITSVQSFDSNININTNNAIIGSIMEFTGATGGSGSTTNVQVKNLYGFLLSAPTFGGFITNYYGVLVDQLGPTIISNNYGVAVAPGYFSGFGTATPKHTLDVIGAQSNSSWLMISGPLTNSGLYYGDGSGLSNTLSITTNGTLSTQSSTNLDFRALGGASVVASNTSGNTLILISAPNTNGFVDASITNGFVDIRITNGLASQAYAQSLTNGFLKQFQILTNGTAVGYATNINWTTGVTGNLSGATANLGVSVSGGAGSQTPWAQDINASQFSVTNINSMTMGASAANIMQFGLRSAVTTLPIAYMAAVSNTASFRLDLFPGSGIVNLLNQPVGIDICTNNPNINSDSSWVRLATDGVSGYLDTQVRGAGTLMELHLKINGIDYVKLLTSGNLEVQNTVAGQSYMRVANSSANAAAATKIFVTEGLAVDLCLEHYNASHASYPNYCYVHADGGAGLLIGADLATSSTRILSGGTSIANNTTILITNKIVTFVGAQLLATNTPAATGTGSTNFIIDCSLANVFNVFPTANFKLWLTNSTMGFQGWINIIQDGSGSRLWVYDSSNIKTNASLILSTPANSVDRIDMRSDSKGTNVQFILNKAFQ